MDCLMRSIIITEIAEIILLVFRGIDITCYGAIIPLPLYGGAKNDIL